MTSSGGQRGGRLGHPTYSLVSIRKNTFWLKQNTICSDRILTFRIRSRFKLRRDGDQCGDLRAVLQDQEPWRLVDEDTFPPTLRMSPGKMLGARGRDGIKRYWKKEREIPKKWSPIFPGNNKDNNPKVWRHTRTPNRPNTWEGDGRGSMARGPGTKSEAVICPGE